MAPVPITIDNTLGAVLVGFAVSCCVYGILITQIYVYFSRYPEDRLVYKFLVSPTFSHARLAPSESYTQVVLLMYAFIHIFVLPAQCHGLSGY